MMFIKYYLVIFFFNWILIFVNKSLINADEILPESSESNSSNVTDSEGLFSGLLSSFISNKVHTCPGECVHAITSLLCDQVIENIPCGSSYFRCCVSKEPFYGTSVETSPPLLNDENEENFSSLSTVANLNEYKDYTDSKNLNQQYLNTTSPDQILNVNNVDKQKNLYNNNTNIIENSNSHKNTSSNFLSSLDSNNSNIILLSFSNKFSSPFVPAKFSTSTTPALFHYQKKNSTNSPEIDLITNTMTIETTSPSISFTLNKIQNFSKTLILNKFKCPGICMDSEYARYCGNIMTNDQACENSKICCIQSDNKIISASNFTTNNGLFLEESSTNSNLIDQSNDKQAATESYKEKNQSEEIIVNNSDKQLNNKQSDYLTTSSPAQNSENLSPCDGNCVTLLFSLLCDEIDKNKYCPNEGKCCKYKDDLPETTSISPKSTTISFSTIGPCPGTCIPTILSGVCNRPSELILKTTTCMMGMICCYTPTDAFQNDKFQSYPSSDVDSNESNMLINSNNPLPNNYFVTNSLINKRIPSIHQLSVLKKPLIANSSPILSSSSSVLPYSSLNWQKFLATQNQQIPLYKPLSANSQLITSQPITKNLRPNNFFNNPNSVTQSSLLENYRPSLIDPFYPASNVNKILSNFNPNSSIFLYLSNFPCPGSCISSLFKFTCFGNNVIYSHFSCSKSQQLCCASLTDIEAYENVLDLVANETLHSFPTNLNNKLNLYNSNTLNYLNIKPNLQSSSNNNYVLKKNSLNPPILNTNNIKINNNLQNYHIVKPIQPSMVSIRKPSNILNRSPLNLESNSQPTAASSIPVFNSHSPNNVFTLNEINNATNNNNYMNIVLNPTNYEEKNSSPKLSLCGILGQQDTGRVVGGSESKPNKWCWHVALLNQQNQYLCGGALIGTQWVLTAAHCITNLVRNAEPIFVRVGDYDLTTVQPEEFGSESLTQQVITTYIHHNHNSETLENDIALIKIQHSLQLKNNICLVCLPTRGSTVQPGKKCTVTGYGYISEDGPVSLKVREANIPIINDRQCTKRINAVTEKNFVLPTSSFCAGGEEGNDACQGDGGGPFVCEEDGFYELTGLVSWGFGCGRQNVPAVYVKVSSFIGWINQIISVNN